MNSRSKVLQKRINALRNKIETISPGGGIDFKTLLRDLPSDLPTEVRGMNPTALTYALKELRKDMENSDTSATLEISKDSVRLVVNDQTIFDQNMQRNVPQKRAISSALWNWLFNFPLSDGVKLFESWTGSSQLSVNERIKTRLENKRNILHGRVNPAIVVDAGSTNTIAIDSFLKTAESVPFHLDEHKIVDDKDVYYKRLIAPLFMTNSIVIADKIARSKFRQSIPVRVIGGTDRPERRSICGELALLWLRACDQEGKMISLDLAVIGATGLETKRFPIPVLGCDAADETSMKSRLLAMSNFKIVLFDSDKILNGGCCSMFASVSEGDIDLIITDSGVDKQAQLGVEKLAKSCNDNGVGLIIAVIS